jgi:hypothetical protein
MLTHLCIGVASIQGAGPHEGEEILDAKMSRLELEDPAIKTVQCPNRIQSLPAKGKGKRNDALGRYILELRESRALLCAPVVEELVEYIGTEQLVWGKEWNHRLAA